MALPPYFKRSAVAASQVLAGFDEQAIRERLEKAKVEVSWSGGAGQAPEGRALLDLLVRLVSRLYPQLRLSGPDPESTYGELARSINPELELFDDAPTHRLVVGDGPAEAGATNFFVGSDGWDALFSPTTAQPVGGSGNAFGSGAAACIGAANLFRALFLDDPDLDDQVVFSTLEQDAGPSPEQVALGDVTLTDSHVLVGAGAVGNAALWALATSDIDARLRIVDPESVELSNLQRYVLATIDDEGKPKVDVAVAALSKSAPHQLDWAEFVSSQGHRWDRVIVALDSAEDRRQVQSTLPRWIANAWTQAGDLGVSVHPWTAGACLSCLYLPKGKLPSEDELVAGALGFDDEQRRSQVRQLLHTGGPPPPELLQQSAAALGIEVEKLLAYADRPLRDLYVEGICGGAVLPLDRVGRPAENVQVPLAHQSALAGVLLAARLVAAELDRAPAQATATRIDLLSSVGSHLAQPIAKDPRGICICQDSVYQAAYDEKYRPNQVAGAP